MKENQKVDDKISDALDIEPIDHNGDNPIAHTGDNAGGIPIVPTPQDMQLKRDYNLVRQNLKDIIDVGSDAIDGILNVASETEAPRAYEVAAQMIKTVSEVNKDLIEMHNKMKQIRKEDGGQKAQNITNNSLFVGSTTELQKLLKRQKQEMIEADIEESESFDIIDVEVKETDDGEG
tara:strand:+ start:1389 stop:1919 length:531 start_codon:yes stop_codon:yes gene_type:complete